MSEFALIDYEYMANIVRSWNAEWTVEDCKSAVDTLCSLDRKVEKRQCCSRHGFAMVLMNLCGAPSCKLDSEWKDSSVRLITGHEPVVIRQLEELGNDQEMDRSYLKHCGPVTVTDVGSENIYVLRHWNNRRHFIKLIN